jgi:hypothetical protein
MKNQYTIEYDEMINSYQVSCVGKFNFSASLGYLKNLDNQSMWKEKKLEYYFELLDWVEKEHPELLI